jgi:hypothetical protein
LQFFEAASIGEAVKAHFEKVIIGIFLSLLLIGCSSHRHSEGELVFKGQVVRVQYMLQKGVTVLVDAEGKTVELSGHPGVPCTEVEIYKTGDHEYEIFEAPKHS